MKSPKPYKTFKITDLPLHNQMKTIAAEKGVSLIECVEQAVKNYIKEDKRQKELRELR